MCIILLKSKIKLIQCLKVDFFLKIKKLNIHLYFIATMYFENNVLVEYVDNWTWSYCLVILYWNCQINFNGAVIKDI